jgi:threonine aldolase
VRLPIDFRSDTITQPTDEMREAMNNATVGDDVYGEDPTVIRLEELAAAMIGKESSLFVPSGTMGNLIALMTHTQRGDEVILEADSHIYYYEAGGMASLAGIMPHPVRGEKGVMKASDIESSIRPYDVHYPNPRLICVENTHNRAGGTVMNLDQLRETEGIARGYGLSIHMDGARIFNAATALGIDTKELADHVDSIMFCLSKGLSAPVGSILAGSNKFIERARKYRKVLGGGMRQAGHLAAAGIVALEKMVDRLKEDHTNARRLAEGLLSIPGISINLDSVQTNMVNVDVAGLGMSSAEIVQLLLDRGIKVMGRHATIVRMVTHRHISSEDVDYTVEVVGEIALSRMT